MRVITQWWLSRAPTFCSNKLRKPFKEKIEQSLMMSSAIWVKWKSSYRWNVKLKNQKISLILISSSKPSRLASLKRSPESWSTPKKILIKSQRKILSTPNILLTSSRLQMPTSGMWLSGSSNRRLRATKSNASKTERILKTSACCTASSHWVTIASLVMSVDTSPTIPVFHFQNFSLKQSRFWTLSSDQRSSP